MPRKRKSLARNKTRKKKKRVKKLTADQQKKITQLTINSVWRAKTKDIVKITESGKEVLSGWQRCRIEKLFGTNDEYPHGAVLVQYLGEDEEDEEPIKYDNLHFISSSAPAPNHNASVDGSQTSSVVNYEQPEFIMQERGELLPLQLRKKSSPQDWQKKPT